MNEKSYVICHVLKLINLTLGVEWSETKVMCEKKEKNDEKKGTYSELTEVSVCSKIKS